MKEYPFHDVLRLIRAAKDKVEELQREHGNTPGGPYFEETLRHLEEAAQSSMKASVYSLPQEFIDNLPE